MSKPLESEVEPNKAPAASTPSTAVRKWLEQVVIKHDFCPFAGPALAREQVRLVEYEGGADEYLLSCLERELQLLEKDSGIETTLLILQNALRPFAEFNQFLDTADLLLKELGFSDRFQIASFHPDYQFADASAEDASNYTNRAPYPTLHILRESSVAWAVDQTEDIDQIPARNVEFLNTASEALLNDIKRYSRSS